MISLLLKQAPWGFVKQLKFLQSILLNTLRHRLYHF